MIFRKQITPFIDITTSIEGLAEHDPIVPKPSQKFLPDWWKTLETKHGYIDVDTQLAGNIKNCPSFPDYFSQGIIIPMWCDTILFYENSSGIWKWSTSDSSFSWGAHSNDQFLNDVSFTMFGNKAQMIFKTLCPWNLITPKGYSVYQLPVFYHYTNEFTILPGVVDTDMFHVVNQQVVFLSEKKEIFIKKGTPFVQYIPFKRETFKVNVRQETPIDKKKIMQTRMLMKTSFMGQKQYIKKRKEEINNG